MRYHFILLDIFLLLRRQYFIFYDFLSYAGGHLDLGINLEWPK